MNGSDGSGRMTSTSLHEDARSFGRVSKARTESIIITRTGFCPKLNCSIANFSATVLPDSSDRPPFFGELFLIQDRDIARAQAVGLTAAAKASTEDHIQVAMFTDASRHTVLGPCPGGYSVVFDNFFPGTQNYGQHIEMGWYMPEMEDTTIGEGIGLAQALEVACHYLNRCSASHTTATRTATIIILSDSYSVIKQINSSPPRKTTHAKVINLIRQKTQELRSVPGFDVSVELRWVPGHLDVLGNEHADHTAARARELRRGVFAVDLVEEEEEPDANDTTSRMPRGLHLQVQKNEDTSNLHNENTSSSKGAPRPRKFKLPRTPWEPSPLRPLDPGRVLTLLPPDDVLISIQLEETFREAANYRHQEVVNMNLIKLQLEEDFQLSKAFRRQQEINGLHFIRIQLEEEGQRWFTYDVQKNS